jgi:hypothetical protein
MASPFRRATASFWGARNPEKEAEFRVGARESAAATRALQLERMGLNPGPFVLGGSDAVSLRQRVPGLIPELGDAPLTPYETQRVMGAIDAAQPPDTRPNPDDPSGPRDIVGPPVQTISRAKRPTADELSVIVPPNVLASPDFDEIAKRLVGETHNASPGTQIVEGSRVIHENPPLLANTPPGGALRDPRTGELKAQNPYGPFTIGEGGKAIIGATPDGGDATEIQGNPKTFSPYAGQPRPVDPVLAANREAQLTRRARDEVIAESPDLMEIDGALYQRTADGVKPQRISPERMEQLNRDTEARKQRYLGAQPAPTIDAPGRAPTIAPAGGCASASDQEIDDAIDALGSSANAQTIERYLNQQGKSAGY